MISLRFLSVCAAAGMIVAAARCGGNGDCSDLGGPSAPCPPPEHGHARVEGTVLYADASPAVLVPVFVICEWPVGLNSNYTDQQGRYAVSLVYASGDTVNQPLPPRTPDGSFELACEAGSEVKPEVVVRDSVAVRFSPPQLPVTPTVVELREPTPSRSRTYSRSQ
jgi:hypothetical protein